MTSTGSQQQALDVEIIRKKSSARLSKSMILALGLSLLAAAHVTGAVAQPSSPQAMADILAKFPEADQPVVAEIFAKMAVLNKDQNGRMIALNTQIENIDPQLAPALTPENLTQPDRASKFKALAIKYRTLRLDALALFKQVMTEREQLVQGSKLKPEQKKSMILGMHDNYDASLKTLEAETKSYVEFFDAMVNILAMAEKRPSAMYMDNGKLLFKSQEAFDIYKKNNQIVKDVGATLK